MIRLKLDHTDEGKHRMEFPVSKFEADVGSDQGHTRLLSTEELLYSSELRTRLKKGRKTSLKAALKKAEKPFDIS